mmetsp:Transcript_6994/g.21410  ORF Transcript_6994/g.21410 Transcript_6994/m.21410 type:complete len:81 (-) Transcript_6994:390-632(-)
MPVMLTSHMSYYMPHISLQPSAGVLEAHTSSPPVKRHHEKNPAVQNSRIVCDAAEVRKVRLRCGESAGTPLKPDHFNQAI